MGRRHALAAALVLSPVGALAQPTLESLWPNQDGLRWEYEFHVTELLGNESTLPASLQLLGVTETPGGIAQVLIANHATPTTSSAVPVSDPLLRALWQARPDLRAAIVARNEVASGGETWWPIFLHGGSFMKNATHIQMWQPDYGHPTWTYLTDELSVGATFTQQLVPELANDVYLHGTVTDIDATVTTIAGTFENAVKMTYRIDYGWSEGTDDDNNVIGQLRGETRGHVHYVPDVGPVELLEDWIPFVEIDCAPNTCPVEWQDSLGVSFVTTTLSLTDLPVAIEARTWTEVKNLYH